MRGNEMCVFTLADQGVVVLDPIARKALALTLLPLLVQKYKYWRCATGCAGPRRFERCSHSVYLLAQLY
jgi:hypothetical protein